MFSAVRKTAAPRVHACVRGAAARVLGVVALGAAALGALGALAPTAHADEQRVKRFGIALYAMPTSMGLGDFNDGIDRINQATSAVGFAPISKVHWSAQFGLEGRFMATKHWVVTAGFGRIKKQSRLDLLPSVGTQILITGNVLTVPRNLGIDYYFAPKTSGNVTVRPFVGAGMLSLVETKAKLGATTTINGVTLGGFGRPSGEGAGAYVEGGMHVMLPSRYSLILNGFYRRAKVTQVVEEFNPAIRDFNPDGSPFSLDMSGFGIRFATQIDFFGKPVK
jgi:outer membrane protein W